MWRCLPDICTTSRVGTSIAIRTGHVCGVYAVLTAANGATPRRGCRRQWAAVNAGREWGCDLASLQATEMALSGYARMGFETVERYTTYARPE
jgi:hypothetical protein